MRASILHDLTNTLTSAIQNMHRYEGRKPRGGSLATVAGKVVARLDRARVAVHNAAVNAGLGQDATARPTFAGERHGVLRLKNGKLGQANYMGPGTAIAARLRRGDPARTPVDAVAMIHDQDYARAGAIADPVARGNAVREADMKMRRAIDAIERAGADHPHNIAQARLIVAKNFAEDLGLLRRDAFQQHNAAGAADVAAAASGAGRVKARGTREEVFHGVARQTSGGLKKGDLMQRGNKYVSKAASKVAKARFAERCT
jgi:hypothetical protein